MAIKIKEFAKMISEPPMETVYFKPRPPYVIRTSQGTLCGPKSVTRWAGWDAAGIWDNVCETLCSSFVPQVTGGVRTCHPE